MQMSVYQAKEWEGAMEVGVVEGIIQMSVYQAKECEGAIEV